MPSLEEKDSRAMLEKLINKAITVSKFHLINRMYSNVQKCTWHGPVLELQYYESLSEQLER